jgi:GWxTD domain-containing protein
MQGRVVAALVSAFFLTSIAEAFQPPETVATPLSTKDAQKRDEKLRKEMESPFDTWLKVDVAYIITDAERKAFAQLGNDDEREQFIEQFWLRRDPTPDTVENEFKEEHYRRLAYANERFASGIPGWKTDRGMIYIKYGPPDEIESHPEGGPYRRPIDQGGGQTSTYPFEQWRYRYLDGIGNNVVIEFVDQTMSGEYRITIDPNDKDALRNMPGSQQQNQNANTASSLGRNEFDSIEQLANLYKPPAIKFKDLEDAVTTSVRYNALPLRVQTDFIPVTPGSTSSLITIQVDRDGLLFQEHDGYAQAVVNIYGRVTTVSQRVVQVFEDVVHADGAPNSRGALDGSAIYQKVLPLAPGRYRLNIAVKDAVGGGISNYEAAIDVPRLNEDQLSASSLIIADIVERAPATGIGSGPFIIGDTKVRPRLGATFGTGERLGIYQQVYSFSRDPVTNKTNGSIEYRIEEQASGTAVLQYTEDVQGPASQVAIEKLLPLRTLGPGSYIVKLKVTDRITGQTITPTANFTVRADLAN